MIALLNDTKHDRVCKSVIEIKEHAENFPNAPRTCIQAAKTLTLTGIRIGKTSLYLIIYAIFTEGIF